MTQREPLPHAEPVGDAARPFQVDLGGVVELLGRTIYSSPRVFLRELLQNGIDAVRARAQREEAAQAGLLEIWPASVGTPFRFRDNGVGLTAAEAGELLSTVGRSSKRDPLAGLRREGYLGQFGVGLLSCFMVADRIVIRSRSASGGAPVEWVGEASGVFRVRELSGEDAAQMPVGTEVLLVPRPDEVVSLGFDEVVTLAAQFGEYLPVTVRVYGPDDVATTVTRDPEFLTAEPAGARVTALGAELLGHEPLAVIALNAPETRTRGVGFVLPFAPPPGAHQAHRVYLGRMLLSPRYDGLLPEWAFFVRGVFDTADLRPTASRESFIDDDALVRTREQLGAAVRAWVLGEAARSTPAFARFVQVHGTGLKSVAAHDDELARILLPWLRFETSVGPLTVPELTAVTGADTTVRYAETVDEFRQIAPLTPASAPVINAGYAYDAELLRRLPDLTGAPVMRVRVSDVLAGLRLPPAADAGAAQRLERRATVALADALPGAGPAVSVRCFAPSDLPGLCLVDEEAVRERDRAQAREAAGASLWGEVLGTVAEAIEARRRTRPTDAKAGADLCLNWESPLVRGIAIMEDTLVLDRTVRLLYAQALLAAHRPLGVAERRLMTGALNDLVALSAGISPGSPTPDATDGTEGTP